MIYSQKSHSLEPCCVPVHAAAIMAHAQPVILPYVEDPYCLHPE